MAYLLVSEATYQNKLTYLIFSRLMGNSCLIDLNLSYNPNLTGISLRRLLECSNLQVINLIGCDRILHYFSDCEGKDYLLQDSDQRQKKLLKLSGDFQQYEQQLQALVDIFDKKYEKSFKKRRDYFGVSSLSISSKPMDGLS